MRTNNHANGKLPRILIVDNDTDFLADTKVLLAADFDCDSVVSVDAARSRLNEYHYDAVLLDIHFGGGQAEGYDLLHSLRQECRMLPVVMISEDKNPMAAFRASHAGAQWFVQKDFRKQDLVDILLRLIQGTAGDDTVPDSRAGSREDWILTGESREAKRLRGEVQNHARNLQDLLVCAPAGSKKCSFARLIHQRSALQTHRLIQVFGADLGPLIARLEEPLSPHYRPVGDTVTASTIGTVLVHEVASLSPADQQLMVEFLLRHPLGETGETGEPPRPRFIFTSSTDLYRHVDDYGFNHGLYELLLRNEFIILPFLARRKDLPELTERLSWELARRMNKTYYSFSDDATRCLQSYDWIKHLSEFEEAIIHALLSSESGFVACSELPEHIRFYRPERDYKKLKDDFIGQFWLTFLPAAIARHGRDLSSTSTKINFSRERLRTAMIQYGLRKFLQDP